MKMNCMDFSTLLYFFALHGKEQIVKMNCMDFSTLLYMFCSAWKGTDCEDELHGFFHTSIYVLLCMERNRL